MGSSSDYATQIIDEVGGWDGVETAPHRFGGVEFRFGRRELGHLHGSRMADLPLPRALHDQLIAEGRAQQHHFLPDSGWVTVPLRSPDDVPPLIEIFRLVYDRAVAQADRARARA